MVDFFLKLNYVIYRCYSVILSLVSFRCQRQMVHIEVIPDKFLCIHLTSKFTQDLILYMGNFSLCTSPPRVDPDKSEGGTNKFSALPSRLWPKTR